MLVMLSMTKNFSKNKEFLYSEIRNQTVKFPEYFNYLFYDFSAYFPILIIYFTTLDELYLATDMAVRV